MLDKDILKSVLESYKRDLPERWQDNEKHKGEKFKWQAIKCFQDNWDINAQDFPQMLERSLEKTGNLLASNKYFPKRMIIEFAQLAPDKVRNMFIELFDESKDVYDRINAFKAQSAVLLKMKKHKSDTAQHFQTENSISVYLWLRYPDKYYIYKFSEVRSTAEMLKADFSIKTGAYAENIRNFLRLYDELSEAVKKDDELVKLFKSLLTDDCYPDPQLKTLAIDVGFYISKMGEYSGMLEPNSSDTETLIDINDKNDIVDILNDFYDISEAEDNFTRKPKEEHEVVPEYKLVANKDTLINTWLLNWNPSNPTWKWEEQEDDHGYNAAVQKVKSGGTIFFSWRCISKQVKEGDRIFLMKLGEKPRGVFATGYAASDTYENVNTDENGKIITERCVDICITGFLDYRVDKLIPQDLLNQTFPTQQWSPQGSGISIKPEAAKWLIENWDSYQKTISNSIDENIAKEPVIWKISHGTPMTSGITKDLRKIFEDKKIVVVNQFTGPAGGSKVIQGYSYMNEIKKGDYFFLCYAGEIVLLGQFTENEAKLNKERGTDWGEYDWYERSYRLIARSAIHEKYTGIKKVWTSNYNSTCVKVTDNALFEELILEPFFGLKISDLKREEFNLPYTKSDFLNEVYISEKRYDNLVGVLHNKMNIILQGAPGVGKTFAARRLAWSIMGEQDDSRIEFVQFHQSYSYEDFVMGYKPVEDSFHLKYGVFYRFCKKAENQPEKDFFFIIDEINRGNLSKIFGELLMLIEKDYRGTKAVLAYDERPFSIPKNLYIIGMMNTADRSLAMIDYALRRRFGFFEMEPGFDSKGFVEYQNSLNSETLDKLISKIKELNNAITNDKSLGKGFCIGHSYFCNRDVCDDEWLHSVVDYDIIPTLREYWFDNTAELQRWESILQGVFE